MMNASKGTLGSKNVKKEQLITLWLLLLVMYKHIWYVLLYGLLPLLVVLENRVSELGQISIISLIHQASSFVC